MLRKYTNKKRELRFQFEFISVLYDNMVRIKVCVCVWVRFRSNFFQTDWLFVCLFWLDFQSHMKFVQCAQIRWLLNTDTCQRLHTRAHKHTFNSNYSDENRFADGRQESDWRHAWHMIIASIFEREDQKDGVANTHTKIWSNITHARRLHALRFARCNCLEWDFKRP